MIHTHSFAHIHIQTSLWRYNRYAVNLAVHSITLLRNHRHIVTYEWVMIVVWRHNQLWRIMPSRNNACSHAQRNNCAVLFIILEITPRQHVEQTEFNTIWVSVLPIGSNNTDLSIIWEDQGITNIFELLLCIEILDWIYSINQL